MTRSLPQTATSRVKRTHQRFGFVKPPTFGGGKDDAMSNKRIVHANGVGLCVEPFGDPADPAILLIHGAQLHPPGFGRENVSAVRQPAR
jgi:hypothetical protein